jgi:predicted RecA/RadA family phage recombinase
MAKNAIERGKSIQIAIPAGGCSSGGQGVANEPSSQATPGNLICVGNDMVGCPAETYAAGTAGNVTLHLMGVFGNIQKATMSETWNVGDKLYVVPSSGDITATASGNTWAGWARNASLATDTVATIQLKHG